jgi:phosphohistidine phosphatase
MKVLLVRHAIALDRATPGIADALRPLTEEGVQKFEKSARAIAALVTADMVFASPLLRAKQTAEILVRQWPNVSLKEVDSLGTGSRTQFEASLAKLSSDAVIAAVGHEPHVSDWTAEWLGSSRGEAFAFKKGGVALIEFDGAVTKRGGRLVFFLGPKGLKDLSA